MHFETIRVTTDEIGVSTLTLARPNKHNAMSGQMIAELAAAAELLANDDKVRAVVLTGEGDNFCAGADLAWMRGQASAARDERIAEARKLALALRALNELPKPLIGRINGQAFGGGLGLISVCDVAVAVDTARFGITEVRLGLIPATISPYVLARMGEGAARRVFMSARTFDANEARELGLLAPCRRPTWRERSRPRSGPIGRPRRRPSPPRRLRVDLGRQSMTRSSARRSLCWPMRGKRPTLPKESRPSSIAPAFVGVRPARSRSMVAVRTGRSDE